VTMIGLPRASHRRPPRRACTSVRRRWSVRSQPGAPRRHAYRARRADRRTHRGHGRPGIGIRAWDRVAWSRRSRRRHRQCRRRQSRHRQRACGSAAVGASAPHDLRRRKSDARAQGMAGGKADRARHDPYRCRRGARAHRRRSSLLAAGRDAVEGRFARGDLVVISGPDGPIARGLAEYDSADAEPLLGRKSDEHAHFARLCAARRFGPPQPHGL
jgi:hypothetical protein